MRVLPTKCFKSVPRQAVIGFLLGVIVVLGLINPLFHEFHLTTNENTLDHHHYDKSFITSSSASQLRPQQRRQRYQQRQPQALYLKVILPEGSSHSVLRCQLQKIEAFLISNHKSSNQMHIHIFHSKDQTIDVYAHSELLTLMKRFKSTTTFHFEMTVMTVHWPIIGGIRSKYGITMKNFIKFGDIYKNVYSHIWLIELDTMYSNSWSHLFNKVTRHSNHHDIDLLVTHHQASKDWRWKFNAPANKIDTNTKCTLFNVPCWEIHKNYRSKDGATSPFYQTQTSIIRLSTKYASILSNILDQKLIVAHFEAFLSNVCVFLDNYHHHRLRHRRHHHRHNKNRLATLLSSIFLSTSDSCKMKTFSSLSVPTRFFTLGGHKMWNTQIKNNMYYSYSGVAIGISKVYNYGDYQHSISPHFNLTYKNLPSNEIYHPVKCLSDLTSGSAALYFNTLYNGGRNLMSSMIRPSNTVTIDYTTVRYFYSPLLAKQIYSSPSLISSSSSSSSSNRIFVLVVQYDEYMKWSNNKKQKIMDKWQKYKNNKNQVFFFMWCYNDQDTYEKEELNPKQKDDSVMCGDRYGIDPKTVDIYQLENKMMSHYISYIFNQKQSSSSSSSPSFLQSSLLSKQIQLISSEMNYYNNGADYIYDTTSTVYKELAFKIQNLRKSNKPLLIKINSHPCSGKSYFIKKYNQYYKNIKLLDFDNFYNTMNEEDGKKADSSLLLKHNSNTALLGFGYDHELNNKVIDDNVILLWMTPKLKQLKLQIEHRQMFRKYTGGYANQLKIQNVREEFIMKKIFNHQYPHKRIQIRPLFYSFEEALEFCMNAFTGLVPGRTFEEFE